jgi:uncharacterized membrane protein
MSDTPLQLIVSAFGTEDGADNALDEIVQAKKERLVRIHEAAVVRRDAAGKLHINERGDLSTGGGAASGAALGAVIGLFGGPIGALLGGAAGAAIGGIAARLIDTGIPDSRLQQIGTALQPGTSAIVAMIEHRWVGEIQGELQRAGGDVLAAAVTADIASQLAAGKDVTYSALAASGGTLTTRRTTGADGTAIQGVASDGENFIAGAISVVQDTASEVVEAGRNLADDVGDATRNTLDSAKDAADSAGDAVRDATKDATRAAEDAKDAASDTVRDAAKDATRAAEDAADAAKRAAKDATS